MHFHLYLGVSRQVLSVSLQYMNSTPINELVSLAKLPTANPAGPQAEFKEAPH